MVEVDRGRGQGKVLPAKKILIATGCRMRRIADLPVDGERVMTSREALAGKTLPKSIVIVGAGAIGVRVRLFLQCASGRR